MVEPGFFGRFGKTDWGQILVGRQIGEFIGGLLLIIWLIGLLGGPWLIYWSFKTFFRHRKIRGLSLSKSQYAIAGRCEFEGYAWPLENTIGPVSRLPVAFFYLEFYVTKGNLRRFRHVPPQSFFLADSEGKVLVTIDSSADFEKLTSHRGDWKFLGSNAQSELADYLKEIRPAALKDAEALVVRECYLPPGAKVYACGNFETPCRGKFDEDNVPAELARKMNTVTISPPPNRWKTTAGQLLSDGNNPIFVSGRSKAEILASTIWTVPALLFGIAIFYLAAWPMIRAIKDAL
ncbi:hypothetical protein BH10BDE1_BH10BDE1_21600 [soil metagenome]